MQTLKTRRDARRTELAALLDQPLVRALMVESAGELPPSIEKWLGELALLTGIPFDNLVADTRMLPKESIRFFYVDQNWVGSLVDGAMSIGTHVALDQELYGVVQHRIKARARQTARHDRRRRRRLPVSPLSSELREANWSGFVLRSQVASIYPGLEVRAFADVEGTASISPLRIAKLAKEVLLCIFDGVPARVDVAQPSEGLSLGGETSETPGEHLLVPRGLGLHDVPAGKELAERSGWVPAKLRGDGSSRVLDLAGAGGTVETIRAALGALGAWSDGDPFGPGAFALQVLRAPERQRFVSKTVLPPLLRSPRTVDPRRAEQDLPGGGS